MIRILVISIAICVYGSTSTFLWAQKIELGLGGGLSNARNDINRMHPLDTRWGYSLFGRYNFDQAWVARVQYTNLALRSYDSHASNIISENRNFNVNNRLYELTAAVEYNFLNYRSFNKKVKLSPFITAGLAYYRFKDLTYGSRAGTHNVGIPFGLGLKYVLSQHLNLGAVFMTTKTFNDRMDDISRFNPTSLDPKIRMANTSTYDWYYSLMFTLSYTFYQVDCPEFYGF